MTLVGVIIMYWGNLLYTHTQKEKAKESERNKCHSVQKVKHRLIANGNLIVINSVTFSADLCTMMYCSIWNNPVTITRLMSQHISTLCVSSSCFNWVNWSELYQLPTHTHISLIWTGTQRSVHYECIQVWVCSLVFCPFLSVCSVSF